MCSSYDETHADTETRPLDRTANNDTLNRIVNDDWLDRTVNDGATMGKMKEWKELHALSYTLQYVIYKSMMNLKGNGRNYTLVMNLKKNERNYLLSI